MTRMNAQVCMIVWSFTVFVHYAHTHGTHVPLTVHLTVHLTVSLTVHLAPFYFFSCDPLALS